MNYEQLKNFFNTLTKKQRDKEMLAIKEKNIEQKIAKEDSCIKGFIKKLSIKEILKAKTKEDKINARFGIADELLRYFYPNPSFKKKKWILSPLTNLKGLLITIGFLDMIKNRPLDQTETFIMLCSGSNEKQVKKYNKALNVQLYILKHIEKCVKILKRDREWM